jgi:Flp pilus assembly protein TadD
MEISYYTHVTEEDYNQKLREMGNYLWDLEQDADLASQRGDERTVLERETQIRRIGERARAFSQEAGRHQNLALFVAGLANRMVRQWEPAAACFFAVLDRVPSNGEAWLELTWCLAEIGRWKECEMAARKSTEFFPGSGAPWSNLALALHQLGRTAEAESAVKEALRFEPNDARNLAIRELIRHNRTRGSRPIQSP